MNAQLIVIDPDIQSGTPVFSGTRVPVQNCLITSKKATRWMFFYGNSRL